MRQAENRTRNLFSLRPHKTVIIAHVRSGSSERQRSKVTAHSVWAWVQSKYPIWCHFPETGTQQVLNKGQPSF